MLLGWCLIYVASTYGVSSWHYLTFAGTLFAMTKPSGAMHVATITNRRAGQSGKPREYVSQLLRRTYRDGSKVKHETLANLSPLPDAAIEAVRAGTGHLQSFTGDHQRLAGQRGPHRLDRGVWQWGQVGQRLVLDLAAVTVGAAQQLADVLAWLTGLVDAPIRDRGYVHRTRRLRHSKQRNGESQIVP